MSSSSSSCSSSASPINSISISETPAAQTTYFSKNWKEANSLFLETFTKFQEKFPLSQHYSHELMSKAPDGSPLFMNAVYLPASTEEKRLVVVNSGIHGAEAPATAACIIQLMNDLMDFSVELPLSHGLFLVHITDPWGFSQKHTNNDGVEFGAVNFGNRRIDLEKNTIYLTGIDSCKGCVPSSIQKKDREKLYKSLFFTTHLTSHHIEDKYNYRTLARKRSGKQLLSTSFKMLRDKQEISEKYNEVNTLSFFQSHEKCIEALSLGQYDLPDHALFGGESLSEELLVVSDWLNPLIENHSSVSIIDLKSRVFSNHPVTILAQLGNISAIKQLFVKIIKQLPQDLNNRTFVEGIAARVNSLGKHVDFGLTVQFSLPNPLLNPTWSSKSQIKIGNKLILERLKEVSLAYSKDDAEIMSSATLKFQQLFYSEDPEWQQGVLAASRDVFSKIFSGYDGIAIPK